jgi:hypothetical protein
MMPISQAEQEDLEILVKNAFKIAEDYLLIHRSGLPLAGYQVDFANAAFRLARHMAARADERAAHGRAIVDKILADPDPKLTDPPETPPT